MGWQSDRYWLLRRIAAFGVACLGWQVHAQPPPVVPIANLPVQSPAPRPVALTSHMEVVELSEWAQTALPLAGTDAHLLTPEQLAKLEWQPAEPSPHPDLGSPRLNSFDNRWHRMRLYNAETSPYTYVICLGSSGYLSDVHAWAVTSDSTHAFGAVDAALPQPMGGIGYTVQLQPGQQVDIYVHALVRHLMLRATSLDNYLAYHHKRFEGVQWVLLAYFGMAVIMLAYNALLGIILRDTTYGWYVLYLSCFLVFVSMESGVFSVYFGTQLHFYYLFIANSFSAVFFLAVIRFSESFLRLRELVPAARPWILVGYGLNAWSIAFNLYNLLVTPLPFFVYDLLEQFVTLYCVFLGAVMGLLSLRQGYRPARFYLLGFSVLIVSAIFFVGIQFHLVSPNPFTVNSLYIGSAMEFGLLSLALGDRINLVKAEKALERERISRDLHDNVGAQLSAVLYGLQLAESGLHERPELRSRIHNLQDDVRSTMTQLRETIWALHHPQLTVQQMTEHLQTYMQRLLQGAPVPIFVVDCQLDPRQQLGAMQGLELFRIIQEACHNAIKYAQCTSLRVTCRMEDGCMVLTVDDNGIGLPPAVLTGPGGTSGFGLENMQQRARLLGGEFHIGNRPEGGTRVKVRMDPKAQMSRMRLTVPPQTAAPSRWAPSWRGIKSWALLRLR